MKFNSKTVGLLSISSIIISVTALIVYFTRSQPAPPPPPAPVETPPATTTTIINEETFPPESRPPPYRDYRPREFQQIGLLTETTTGEVLPLYGRGAPNYRDRWNYYSSTPGQQIYSLPVTSSDGRDCTEDIGCNELYGGETVTVFGQSGTFDVKIYRIEQRPYFF